MLVKNSRPELWRVKRLFLRLIAGTGKWCFLSGFPVKHIIEFKGKKSTDLRMEKQNFKKVVASPGNAGYNIFELVTFFPLRMSSDRSVLISFFAAGNLKEIFFAIFDTFLKK